MDTVELTKNVREELATAESTIMCTNPQTVHECCVLGGTTFNAIGIGISVALKRSLDTHITMLIIARGQFDDASALVIDIDRKRCKMCKCGT